MHLQPDVSHVNGLRGAGLAYKIIFISSGVVVVIITIITIAITKNNTESTELLSMKGKQHLIPLSLFLHSILPPAGHESPRKKWQETRTAEREKLLWCVNSPVQAVKIRLDSQEKKRMRTQTGRKCFPSSSRFDFLEYRLEQNRTLQLSVCVIELIVVFPPCSPKACLFFCFSS